MIRLLLLLASQAWSQTNTLPYPVKDGPTQQDLTYVEQQIINIPAKLGQTGIVFTTPAGTPAITFTGGATISSAPVFMLAGTNVVGTLASGTTFQSFIPDSAISLVRMCATINVAGSGGSGDTFKCNNSAGTGVSVTVGAGTTAGTTTCATTGAPAAISYQSQVFCHIESGASPRPIANIAMEYLSQ